MSFEGAGGGDLKQPASALTVRRCLDRPYGGVKVRGSNPDPAARPRPNLHNQGRRLGAALRAMGKDGGDNGSLPACKVAQNRGKARHCANLHP